MTLSDSKVFQITASTVPFFELMNEELQLNRVPRDRTSGTVSMYPGGSEATFEQGSCS